MKKIILVILVTGLLISGCSLFKKDPQKAVNEGITSFADVQKSSSQLVMSGTINAPPGEKPATVRFTIDASGKSDVVDKESPAVDMVFKLQASLDDKSGSGELSVRTVDKKLFINLTKLEIPGQSGEAIATQLSSVLNKWWSLPLGDNNPFGKFSTQQQEVKDKLKTTQFFVNSVEDGKEEVEGASATRYRVDLNKEAFKKFIIDIARLTGNQPTPEEEIAFSESLNEVEWSGAVWVGDDDVLHRIRGTVTVQPKQGPNTSFEIDYRGWDYGKDVAVTAPESSQEFNPLMILPLLGAFQGLDQAGVSPVVDEPLGSSQVAPQPAPAQ